MKKMFMAIFIAAISYDASSQQKNLKDLIGRWEILGEKHAGAYLEVIDSSNMILVYNGEKKKITDYKIDFSKSPIWFDFSTGDSSAVVTVKSLMEIMNNSIIKWQLFMDQDRTPDFSATKGELFYLRKAIPGPDTGIAVKD